MTAEPADRLTPPLRFPEFADAPGWEYLPLKALAKRVTQRQGNDVRLRPLTNSAERGIIDQRDYFDKDIAVRTDDYYVVRTGDYVYNPRISSRAPVGPISKNRVGSGVMSPLYSVFRFHSEDNDFYAHYFKSSHWHDYLRSVASSGARHDRMAVTNDDLLRMPLPSPSPEEQLRIAACLASLEALIDAEGNKLDALRRHKQGLMQGLFPQPGQTVPRLRFREFENAKVWTDAPLENLARRGSGHTPSRANSEYYNGGVKWVSLADSSRLDCGLIVETAVEISEAGVANSSASVHPAGTVVLSRDAGVGKSAILGGPMAVSQHFISWTCKPAELSNWFLYYNLQRLKPDFERIATGSTIKTIGLPFFKALRIHVPELAEQTRVADCLSSLDNVIAAQGRRVDQLKAHGLGLRHQLFPSQGEPS